MSFTNTGMKPKLVEIKVVEKIIKVQQDNKPYNFKIWNMLCNFIINNLFIIIIFTLIGILLLYRYFDVKSKKKKKIKDDSEEEENDEEIQYIEEDE